MPSHGGEIAQIRALTSSSIRNFEFEDTAAIALRFANGALGTATLSDAVPAPWSWEIASGEDPAYPRERENCYFFSGTEGSLALPQMHLWKYVGKKGWYAPLYRETLKVGKVDPQVRQMQHFCRVIRGEEAPRVSGADATRTLEAVLAIRAAATGEAA